MMMVYHQPYSEIKKIPYNELLFFIEYHNAKSKYEKQLIEKRKREMEARKNRSGKKLIFKKKPSMRDF